MGAEQIFDWNKAAASTLEWWQAAGVDMLASDEPFDWLAAPEPEAEPRVAEQRMPERRGEAPAAPAVAVARAPLRRHWRGSSRGGSDRMRPKRRGAARSFRRAVPRSPM